MENQLDAFINLVIEENDDDLMNRIMSNLDVVKEWLQCNKPVTQDKIINLLKLLKGVIQSSTSSIDLTSSLPTIDPISVKFESLLTISQMETLRQNTVYKSLAKFVEMDPIGFDKRYPGFIGHILKFVVSNTIPELVIRRPSHLQLIEELRGLSNIKRLLGLTHNNKYKMFVDAIIKYDLKNGAHMRKTDIFDHYLHPLCVSRDSIRTRTCTANVECANYKPLDAARVHLILDSCNHIDFVETLPNCLDKSMCSIVYLNGTQLSQFIKDLFDLDGRGISIKSSISIKMLSAFASNNFIDFLDDSLTGSVNMAQIRDAFSTKSINFDNIDQHDKISELVNNGVNYALIYQLSELIKKMKAVNLDSVV